MRTLATAIKNTHYKMQQGGTWAYLFKVVVNASTTKYYTNHPYSVTYDDGEGSQTYTPYTINAEDIPDAATQDVQTFNIGFGTMDKVISGYLEDGDLLGNDISIYSVYLERSEAGAGDTVVLAIADTYKMLRAETKDIDGVVVIEVGHENFYTEKFPKNRWIDSRCQWVYKSVGYCDYGNDEFLGLTQLNLLVGGDAAKLQGWTFLNSVKASVADINITTASKLAITIDDAVTAEWTLTVKTAPFLYRIFPDSDIEVEIDVTGSSIVNDSYVGVMVCNDADAPTQYFNLFRYTTVGGTGRVAYNFQTSPGVGGNTGVDDSTAYKLKITKAADVFTAYYSVDGVTWTKLSVSKTLTGMDGVSLRAGIFVGKGSTGTGDIESETDYFHLNAGGYVSCDRTLADCIERDNQLRFGAVPGNLHGPLRL